MTLTVLGQRAAAIGFEVVDLQAVAGSAGLVGSLLQEAASRTAGQSGPWTRAERALDRVASVSLGVAGVSAAISTHPAPGQGPGGEGAVSPGTLAEALASLAATLHRLNVDHPKASVMFAGTGLPHVPEVLRTAGVTHPDRLFLVEHLSVTLAERDAVYAVVEPARRVGVLWQPEADVVDDVHDNIPAFWRQRSRGEHGLGPSAQVPQRAGGSVAVRERPGRMTTRHLEAARSSP